MLIVLTEVRFEFNTGDFNTSDGTPKVSLRTKKLVPFFKIVFIYSIHSEALSTNKLT